MYIQPRSRENVLLAWQVKIVFLVLNSWLVRRGLSSTFDRLTDDLNLIWVDPNQSLVCLMKRSTFGLGLTATESYALWEMF